LVVEGEMDFAGSRGKMPNWVWLDLRMAGK
jgi:hypothetical protein